jgi:hypothetical protein
LVFEQSAQCAAFFEHGKDRSVMPGIASNRGEPPKVEEPERRGGSGDGGGERPRHPFTEGLLRTLPDPDSETEWPLEKRVKWLQTAANIFDLIYKGEGGTKVELATAHRTLRPHD